MPVLPFHAGASAVMGAPVPTITVPRSLLFSLRSPLCFWNLAAGTMSGSKESQKAQMRHARRRLFLCGGARTLKQDPSLVVLFGLPATGIPMELSSDGLPAGWTSAGMSKSSLLTCFYLCNCDLLLAFFANSKLSVRNSTFGGTSKSLERAFTAASPS